MSSTPTYLISLVGFQPTAVAAGVAAWKAAYGSPEGLTLLATKQVLPAAERLKVWAENHHDIPCAIIEVSNGLTPAEGGPPTAPQAAEAAVAAMPAAQWVFLADAGLNFLVAAVGRQLPGRVAFAHSLTHLMHIGMEYGATEAWTSVPLQHLGMQMHLELSDWKLEHEAPADMASDQLASPLLSRVLGKRKLPHGTLRRVRVVAGAPARRFRTPLVALLGERHGRLHAVVELEPLETLSRTREVLEMTNELRDGVRILVLTSNHSAISHLAASGSVTPLSARAKDAGNRIVEWLDGSGAPVGGDTLEPAPVGPLMAKKFERHPAPGNEPRVEALVVALSRDPATTLSSLVTHRPRTAYVIYDDNTPALAERMRRLLDEAGSLQVERMVPVRTNILGSRIGGELEAAGANGEREVLVDVTPGTKAQGWALARWARNHRASVWSQDMSTRQASRIDGVPESIPLEPVPLLLRLAVAGGPLLKRGRDLRTLKKDEFALFDAYGRILLRYISKRKPKAWNLDKVVSRTTDVGTVTATAKGRNSKQTPVRIDMSDGRTLTGQIPDGGRWLEVLTLAACRALKPVEARSDVRWAWPEMMSGRRRDAAESKGHRADGDVVLQLGVDHRLATVLLECKVGQDARGQRLTKTRRDVAARAHHQVSRFTLPVVVVPRHVQPPEAGGAEVLDLTTLLNPYALDAFIKDALTRRPRHTPA